MMMRRKRSADHRIGESLANAADRAETVFGAPAVV